MNRCALLFLVLAMALPAWVLAQSDPPPGTSVLMTASCSGSDVVLSIDFNVTEAPPAEFVGWVVDRQVLGFCTENVWVTDVMPWPELGQTHLDLTVTPDVGYLDVIYRIWAVDAAGNETFINWPQRHNFAHADCLPGPSTVGHFEETSPDFYEFVPCGGYCWPWLSPYGIGYIPELEPYFTNGVTVALYGELIQGMHGMDIRTSAVEPSYLQCDVVPTDRTTWSGLKADYR